MPRIIVATLVTAAVVLGGSIAAWAVYGLGLSADGTPLIYPNQVLQCKGGDGDYQRSYRQGGTLVKGTCTGGIAVGTWKGYHESGLLEYKAPFVEGKVHGLFKAWYDDPDAWFRGPKRVRAHYEHGHKQGKYKSWHRTGKVAAKGRYVGNERVGCWTFYHPSGKRRAKGAYVSGEKAGTWFEWNAQGRRSKEKFGGETSQGRCWWPLF